MGEQYKKNVYYNPPSQLSYPCIIYSLGDFISKKAGDKKHIRYDRYTVTLVCSQYTNDYVDKLNDLEYCEFDRHYVSDNLHHFVYTINIM